MKTICTQIIKKSTRCEFRKEDFVKIPQEIKLFNKSDILVDIFDNKDSTLLFENFSLKFIDDNDECWHFTDYRGGYDGDLNGKVAIVAFILIWIFFKYIGLQMLLKPVLTFTLMLFTALIYNWHGYRHHYREYRIDYKF